MLKKNGIFAGWNTRPDGTGIHLNDMAEITAKIKNLSAKSGGTVKLYGKWKKI